MNHSKVLCNVSNGVMPDDIREHKQNYDTYTGLLAYFSEIHIICRSANDHVIQEGRLFIHHVGVPDRPLLRYLFSIVKMIQAVFAINKTHGISILNASEPTTGGMVAALANLILQKPFLLEVQGEMTNISPSTVGLVKSKAMRFLTLFSARRATHIRAVSDIIKEQLVLEGFPENKISIVYPRIRLDDFDSRKFIGTKSIIRRKHNLPQEKTVFLFVGRLVVFKGLKHLLEAIALISNSDVLFVIAGDGDLRAALEKQASDAGILDRIRFTGAISYTDIPALMSSADYFILPSVDEGFGRVVIEAMAMRLPVLASRVGGIKDIISDGLNGFFFEPRNPKSIVETIHRVLQATEAVKQQIIDNAYNKVYNSYEYENGMNRYIAVYKKTLYDI